MRQRKRWRDLSTSQKASIIVLGAAQIALLAAAQADLRRRPAHEIRGSTPLWTALTFVNFVGPIAYFLFGRERNGSTEGSKTAY